MFGRQEEGGTTKNEGERRRKMLRMKVDIQHTGHQGPKIDKVKFSNDSGVRDEREDPLGGEMKHRGRDKVGSITKRGKESFQRKEKPEK